MRFYKPLLIALLFILPAGKLFATHYYGVDLFYTHVSGTTYRITMVSYGDCSGTQFPSFSTYRPRIYIMKGTALFIDDFLDQEPPKQGVEVTPVCPAELNNTTCKSLTGTVPGVTKFVYSKEFTLDGPAPDWKFIYKGQTDGNTIAGRSNSLTNVVDPGIIRLEATLNNTQYDNSSPQYTTIATPFYCANTPVNFNPGAVDKESDSLAYELVRGVDSSGTVVQYVQPLNHANPLDVVYGKFKFSGTTGQLDFTPRYLQRSLVVYKVSEYRNGVLLGTSMREMTVVILPCSNNPPKGYITNGLGCFIVDSVTVNTCGKAHDVAFDINPTDADSGHIINMVSYGLPKDANLNIMYNNTSKPQSRFVWSMPDLPKGSHTFFVTYTDNGCPIASKQTVAYTIHIVDEDIVSLPQGYISNAIGARILDSVTVLTCKGDHEVSFDINPTDDKKRHINMVPGGLPNSSRLDITNNNTKQPLSRFVWNMPDLPDGDYTFYVDYTNDGCPAGSRKQAYTVRVAHDNFIAEVMGAGCVKQGIVKLISPEYWSPWSFTVSKNMTTVYSVRDMMANTWSDSIPTGKYKVHAVNVLGCTSEAEVEIPFNCYLADLPSGFSPNGDGKNDLLMVRGQNIKQVHLKIYNRWAQVVFETHDANTGWDGTFNGQDAPIESYAYALSVVFKNDEVFQKQGNVTLLR